VLIVLADNQQQIAQGLKQAGAVDVLQGPQQIAERLPRLLTALASSSTHRVAMSQAARRIADGNGVATVIQHLGP
jgi:UDP-N-acetylglucosamine:LPS N-acetylglucosamine transferase